MVRQCLRLIEVDVTEKRCRKCGLTKPATAFGLCSRNDSGLNERCKDCVNRAAHAYRQTPKGKSSYLRPGGYSSSAQEKREYDLRRFWSLVEKSEGCWIWKGPPSDDGYGRMQLRSTGIRMRANRACWFLTYGAIPDGLLVCHKCDNPPCVRPDHLFLGTYQDNNRDASVKGRSQVKSKGKPGVLNCKNKLSEDQVRLIRQRRASGETLSSLAREHHVSVPNIANIVSGKIWGHVL